MNRRDFTGALVAMGGVATTGATQAQGGPVEGTHYMRLASPVPVSVPGKVEVLEFFMYSCPHCFQFDPALDAWVKKLPADVSFRRVPVAFRPNLEIHQRLYYALEALNQLETLHIKAFTTIHVEHKMLLKDEDVAAWSTANGLDGAKLLDTMKSFAVAGKVRAAKQAMEAYRVDGVPMLAIQGRWTTSGSTAGTHEKALAVADYLIAQARRTKA
ncbi:thiol:disulfide interchange protein DsbA/DsbL [Ideonella sp. 4Y11]|uniref:Thiol:disulfide interchange protein n=1 Tax=Ideonella aquatica TaxID=2824119 RepID=A0A940YJB0_9BURK|nr:thiol:disulfide interchange protein DsbA/DsbL [Ideonella aquatica]